MRAFRVVPMAARVWQTCARRLTTQSEKSHYNVSKPLNKWSFSHSVGTFLRSHGELGGRTRAASCELWIQSRFYSARVGAGSCCGRTIIETTRLQNLEGRHISLLSHRGSAMRNSTLSSNPEDASQDPQSGIVSLKNDVEGSENQEFVPENVDTPRTPLVQAIQGAQEDEFSEDSSPRSGISVRDISPSGREVDATRVFVGGLPFDTRGDELREVLRELLGKYGTVIDVELAKHRNQSRKSSDEGKHRGFAFVTLSSPEEAQAVIEELNGGTLLGRTITVSFSLKRVLPDPSDQLLRMNKAARLARRKVFVGNLHEDTTLETLEDKFKNYGTVTGAKLICELATKKSRGFGFITFSTEAEAMKAILDLDGSILDGSVIRVNIAKYPQGV